MNSHRPPSLPSRGSGGTAGSAAGDPALLAKGADPGREATQSTPPCPRRPLVKVGVDLAVAYRGPSKRQVLLFEALLLQPLQPYLQEGHDFFPRGLVETPLPQRVDRGPKFPVLRRARSSSSSSCSSSGDSSCRRPCPQGALEDPPPVGIRGRHGIDRVPPRLAHASRRTEGFLPRKLSDHLLWPTVKRLGCG